MNSTPARIGWCTWIAESRVFHSALAATAFAGLAVWALAPGPGLMVVLALVVFGGLKYASMPYRGRAQPWRRIAYFLCWPGMDGQAFLAKSPHRIRVRRRAWTAACLKTLAGLAVVWGVARFVPQAEPFWVGLVSMIGWILVMHCGVFHMLALVWQRCSVPVVPIMNSPLRAKSLSDFWSRRWNLAFRDFSHDQIFRPLARRTGSAGAVLAVFLFSGIVHDVVISGSAGAGFGLPTLYFLIQGVGVLWERVDGGRGLVGRIRSGALVLIPLPLLFHRPFAALVVMPGMRLIGAL